MSGINIVFKKIKDHHYTCLVIFDKIYDFKNIITECEDCEIHNSIVDIRNTLGSATLTLNSKFQSNNEMQFPKAISNAVDLFYTMAHIDQIENNFFDMYFVFKDTYKKNHKLINFVTNCFCNLQTGYDEIKSNNVSASISRYIASTSNIITSVNIVHSMNNKILCGNVMNFIKMHV